MRKDLPGFGGFGSGLSGGQAAGRAAEDVARAGGRVLRSGAGWGIALGGFARGAARGK